MSKDLQKWAPAFIILLLFALVTWLGSQKIAQTHQESLRSALSTSLSADATALQTWVDDQVDDLQRLAQSPKTRTILHELILAANDRADPDLAESPYQREFTNYLEPLTDATILVVDQAGRFVGGSHSSILGERIPKDWEEYFLLSMDGLPSFIPPHRARFPLGEDNALHLGEPIACIMTPIPADDDLRTASHLTKTRGALVMLVDPRHDFSSKLGMARVGETGESYAVSNRALLLSVSRYESQLYASGLLQSNETSILHVPIKAPDWEATEIETSSSIIEQWQQNPMTQAAASVARCSHESDPTIHFHLQPYINYRGVEVVGASQWLPRLRIGLVTEANWSALIAPRHSVTRILWSFVLIAATLLLGFLFYSLSIHQIREKLRKTEQELKELGQYQLIECIGEGGMGQVFRAQHSMLKREAAIKMIRSTAGNEVLISRFEREATATSRLQHPNTIQVYDYGRTDDGTFYYAMEYLNGINLQRLVEQYGPVPDQRVLHILIEACYSLREAHSNNLIHRDIKPSNIMLCQHGGLLDRVKLLDFGLVRNVSSGVYKTLTVEGSVAGTPAYMSPEACQTSAEVDARSDLYALGCVAYFLLSGHAPLVGRNPIETCWKQVREAPQPLDEVVDRATSDVLVELIMRCLEKDPKLRPQSAKELQQRLLELTPMAPFSVRDCEVWWGQVHESTAESKEKRETTTDFPTNRPIGT